MRAVKVTAPFLPGELPVHLGSTARPSKELKDSHCERGRIQGLGIVQAPIRDTPGANTVSQAEIAHLKEPGSSL